MSREAEEDGGPSLGGRSSTTSSRAFSETLALTAETGLHYLVPPMSPTIRIRRLVPGMRGGLPAALLAVAVVACIDRPSPTQSIVMRGVSFSVAAQFSRLAGEAAPTRVIVLTASYVRRDNERILLAQEVISAQVGTQQVAMTVDLKRCLDDPARDGDPASCPLRLVVALRDSSTQAALDSTEFGPLAVTPGQSVALTMPSVDPGAITTGLPGVTKFTFTASSKSASPSYVWDFGDGATASGPTVTHVFASEGTFRPTVRVAASDGGGKASAVVSVRSLSGHWVRAPVQGVSHHLVIVQQGATLTGQWFVYADGTAFGPPSGAITSYGLSGAVHDPRSADLAQGGECLRTLTGATVSSALDAISGNMVYGNPSCGANGPFAFTRDTISLVRSVSISPQSPRINVGATATLTATLDIGVGTSPTVNWSTSNTAVASVTSGGVVTGVAPGTSTLTATSIADPTKVSSTTVTVASSATVRSVTVSPASTGLAIGGTYQLTTVLDADVGADRSLTWTSTAPAAVSVAGGLVTGVSAGSATITARSVANPSAAGSSSITARTAQLSIQSINDVSGGSTNLNAIRGSINVSMVGDIGLAGISTVRVAITSGSTTTVAASTFGGPGATAPVLLTVNTVPFPNGPVTISVQAANSAGTVIASSSLSGTISNP